MCGCQRKEVLLIKIIYIYIYIYIYISFILFEMFCKVGYISKLF